MRVMRAYKTFHGVAAKSTIVVLVTSIFTLRVLLAN